MTHQNIEQITSKLTTINDFVRFGASAFNQAGIYFGHGTDNAWDESVYLTMFTLNLPDSLFAQVGSCALTQDEKEQLIAIFQRRIDEEIPAAYLTNQATFAGLPFYVDERVLVPRSPIGELIEKQFDGLLPEGQTPNRILDLCTGSGCIAIACAYQFPDAEVDALDLSVDALNVCQINIESHGLMSQVIPIQSDIFSGVEGQVYDLIVTNPPYVDQEDVDALPQEFLHEPAMGLGSGHDGLDITRQILAQAAEHLSDNGVLICEVGNSLVHLEASYPEVAFNWLSFERGGHGVFMLTKAQLDEHAEIFQARAK